MVKLNHDNVSYVKSFIRIVAGVCLITSHIVGAGILIVTAEFLGILEEQV